MILRTVRIDLVGPIEGAVKQMFGHTLFPGAAICVDKMLLSFISYFIRVAY